jgi:hypothetical protein
MPWWHGPTFPVYDTGSSNGDVILAALPNTVLSFSRHGVVSTSLTAERPCSKQYVTFAVLGGYSKLQTLRTAVKLMEDAGDDMLSASPPPSLPLHPFTRNQQVIRSLMWVRQHFFFFVCAYHREFFGSLRRCTFITLRGLWRSTQLKVYSH